jgi:hypothetical protein
LIPSDSRVRQKPELFCLARRYILHNIRIGILLVTSDEFVLIAGHFDCFQGLANTIVSSFPLECTVPHAVHDKTLFEAARV